ncbi:MAG: polysaccharide deacetylase family protein [bacterium]|nr:polysaccharide deacetylase family protein [bacterium]
MHADISLRKICVLAAIIIMLMGCVAGTLAVKEARFGSMPFTYALKRIGERYVFLANYSSRWALGGGTSLAAAIAGISAVRYRHESPPTEALPVLIYHALTREPNGHKVTRALFAEQMFILKRAGWHTVTLRDAAAFLDGTKRLPARSFLLTFDDGPKESFYPVDPVLQILGFRAVNFILPKYSTREGSSYYLSEGEIASMLASGRWEIGSHGQDGHDASVAIDREGNTGSYLAHPLWLAEEDRTETLEEYRARIGEDLRVSRERLEAVYGLPVHTFAFPFGDFGQLDSGLEPSVVLRDRAHAVYDTVFYQTFRGEGLSQNYPDPHHESFMVKRIEVSSLWDGKDLLAVLESGYGKDLPYRDIFETNTLDWFSMWGEHALENGVLKMVNSPGETGSAALLDGTGHWGDYEFRALVASEPRTGVLLWARFKDKDNNAACNFGNGFAHVEETLEGERRVIKGERRPSFLIPEGTFSVGIRVEGRVVSCSMNDEVLVASEFLEPELSQGGIGIKIWDPEVDKSELVVDSVSVTPIRATTPRATPIDE